MIYIPIPFNPLRAVVMTYSRAKVQVNGQSVPKIEWGNRQMEGQVDGGDCTPTLMLSVKIVCMTGLMWMSQVGVQNGIPPIRHWCSQDDQMPAYGWIAHDGVNFGAQEIIDSYFILTTAFVKKQGGTHGGDWSARFGLIPRGVR